MILIIARFIAISLFIWATLEFQMFFIDSALVSSALIMGLDHIIRRLFGIFFHFPATGQLPFAREGEWRQKKRN